MIVSDSRWCFFCKSQVFPHWLANKYMALLCGIINLENSLLRETWATQHLQAQSQLGICTFSIESSSISNLVFLLMLRILGAVWLCGEQRRLLRQHLLMPQELSGKNQLKVLHNHFSRVCLASPASIIWVNFMKKKSRFLNLSKIF